MGRDRTMSAALQLHHDAGLILSNLQVLGQFVTSLSRMSLEVMQVAFAHNPFPTDAIQFVAPSHRVRQAAHYMAAMGLWRPPSTQGIPGPLSSTLCNACMTCSDCFPDLPKFTMPNSYSDLFPSGGGGGGTYGWHYVLCPYIPTRPDNLL